AEAGRGFRILSNMEIDLGEKFRVFGAGVDARLEGRLVLSGRLPDAPRLTGTVKIVQGTWTGFGQRLEIERGTLVFSGPVDNPALDIVAFRRFLPVEAGVSVSGTARVPKLALVSKPDVPEAEKLSWLVLGTGSDNSRTGAQTVALQAAAASFLASADPNARVPSLAQTFGLDVVSIRTGQVGSTGESGSASTSAQDSIVTLGKRLTDRLFVSYEQSLRGLQNLVRLQYEITERLSVRGSAGTRNAVDLLWQFRYD
ncbi:MAG: translocation/assembly module TamB domain-containing protein, partial [Burkholderiales bacterium]